MTVKINASVLGIEDPIEVKENIKNMKQVLNVQMLIDKYDKVDTDKDTDDVYQQYLQNQLKTQELVESFTLDILGLKGKKYQNKYEELTLEDATDLMQQITTKVMHVDMSSEESQDAQKSDPESDAPVHQKSGENTDPE